MYTALLIDDEPAALKILRWEIEEHCEDIQIIGQFSDPLLGKEAILDLHPDIVFLDIEMPKLNGLDLIYQLEGVDFEVIFITAYDRYAVEAFRLNAIDYLLKPFETAHLQEAVNRVKKKIANPIHTSPSEELIRRLKASFNKISLPNSDGMEFVSPNEILYCKSQGSYSLVIMSRKKMIVTRTLGELEDQLKNFNFIRTHKSYLININHIIQFIRKDGAYLIMANGDKVAVSRRKREVMLQIFQH